MRLKVIAVSVVLLFLVTSSLGILSGNAQGSVNALNEASSSSYGTYNVTFEEKGLPSGIYWGVNVNSSGFLSQGTQITVHLANGTYNYNVSVENSSFDPVYPSGSFLVSGNPVNIPVQFRNVTYPVVFSENGLSPNSTWSVTVGTINQTAKVLRGGTGDSMRFDLINGSYLWQAAPSGALMAVPGNGSFKVDGNLTVINLRFEVVYSQIVFEEFNLPSNTSWFVNFNGFMKYTHFEVLTFVAVYGNYTYSTGVNDSLYHPSPSSGTVKVSNPDVYVNVNFWSRNYTVVFTETGLPAGSEWSVSVGPYVNNSTASEVSFSLPNGSYNYILSTGTPKYAALNASGTFDVNASGINLSVTFEPVTYYVNFNRSGPSGIKWQVAMGGIRESTISSMITFREEYGNYSYNVSIFNSDYSPLPLSGTVYLTGNITITVSFSPVTFLMAFIEKGLPSGQSWSVALGNNTLMSSGGSISFNEMNGSYDFMVSTEGNYTIFPSSGVLTVSGADKAMDILFTPYAYVSFDVSGLPKGIGWSVTVDGRQMNSSSPILSMEVPMGIYYYAPNSSGNFTYSVSLPSGYSLANESSFNASASVTIMLAAQSTGSGVSSLGIYVWVWMFLMIIISIAWGAWLWWAKKGRKGGSVE